MTYSVLTTETSDEFAERMITSYAKAAINTDNEFIAFWYARECVRLDRWRFERRRDAIINKALTGAVRAA